MGVATTKLRETIEDSLRRRGGRGERKTKVKVKEREKVERLQGNGNGNTKGKAVRLRERVSEWGKTVKEKGHETHEREGEGGENWRLGGGVGEVS